MVGATIRELRKKLGLTQEQLAGHELTKSYVSQVELGRINPSQKALQIIAKRLGKPVGYFVENRDDLRTIAFLLKAAQALWSSGRLEEGMLGLTEALTLAERTGREDWMARIKAAMGQLEILRERYDRARRYLEESLALSGPDENPAQAVEVANLLGVVAGRQGSFHHAMHSFQMALEFAERLNGETPRVYADAARNYGDFCYGLGQWNSALELYERALGDRPEALPLEYPADLLTRIANAATRLSQYAKAADSLGEADQRLTQVTEPLQRAVVEANMAEVFRRLGETEEGYRRLKASLELFEKLDAGDLQIGGMHILLALCAQSGQTDWLDDVGPRITASTDAKWAPVRAKYLLLKAWESQKQGRLPQAEERLLQATEWCRRDEAANYQLALHVVRMEMGRQEAVPEFWQTLLESQHSPANGTAFLPLPPKNLSGLSLLTPTV